MPALDDAPFAQIIPLIPVLNHSEEVNAAWWGPHFAQAGLQAQFDAIFGQNASIRLSRNRLRNFAYPNGIQKCLEVMLWGFPHGMRGNQLQMFLGNVAGIAAAADAAADWHQYYDQLHGLGASLNMAKITKLAYFHHRIFDGNTALILDEKIKGICESGRWEELRHLRRLTVRRYCDYLRAINGIAERITCRPDQIGFFLFQMGTSFE